MKVDVVFENIHTKLWRDFFYKSENQKRSEMFLFDRFFVDFTPSQHITHFDHQI